MSSDDELRVGEVEWLDVDTATSAAGSARGRSPRWLAALLAGGLAVTVVAVVNDHRGKPMAAPIPSHLMATPSPSAARSSSASAATRPWPTAKSSCGGQAFLPLVSSALPLAERTGLQVRIGPQMSTVDVDQARVSPQPNLRLAAGEFVSQLVPDGSGSVALITTCDQGAPSRVMHVDADGHVHQIAVGHFDGLLAGGRRPWAYRYPVVDNAPERLSPLDGRVVLSLPVGFAALGAYQDLIIGYLGPPAGSAANTAGPLVTLDPATGRVHATVGPGSAAATVGAGLILWTDGACTPSARCMVHRYELATGANSAREYHLGLSTDAYLGYGLISPDQRLLAFQLHRPAPDPRFVQDHPGNPTDIAVLHLDTGQLDTVPGIELWSKASPGLLFSPDSRWLIIGLDGGTRTSLLLWHPGLIHPTSVVEIPGLTWIFTPLAARLTSQ